MMVTKVLAKCKDEIARDSFAKDRMKELGSSVLKKIAQSQFQLVAVHFLAILGGCSAIKIRKTQP